MARTDSSLDPVSPIAIVGMACRFPKAPDLRSYWRNLRDGVDAVGPIPKSHWDIDDYFDPDPKRADHTYAKRGAFLGESSFYPLEFGISPRDIEATDTTQLFSMLAAREAMWDAGYAGPNAKSFDRAKTSVMLGVTGSLELVIPLGARLSHPHWRRALEASGVEDSVVQEVLTRMSNAYVPWQENSFPGLLGNVAAGRIANRLDLHGTNCVVDAACASSLSALHLACLELQSGRADMALSGGVDTFNDIFMYMCFSKTPALSKTGDARPFSADADGTILGEGVGVLVLKRLEDAKRDQDHIYAVIKGLGTSSDGKGNAVYAPSSPGQRRCLLDAYAQSGLTPDKVELVEAHGTGTPVGDGIELSALTSVFEEHKSAHPEAWCAVGSVKSMIGHTKAAAGVAGLMKCVLALNARVLPPTLKADNAHEKLQGEGPLYLLQDPVPWIRQTPKEPRRAGVSAFGFGGSNFHCLLEQSPIQTKAPFAVDSQVGLLAISAPDQTELCARVDRLRACSESSQLRLELARLRADYDPLAPFRLTHVLNFDLWSAGISAYMNKLAAAALNPESSEDSTYVAHKAPSKGAPKLRLQFGALLAQEAASVFLWSDAAVDAAEACFANQGRAAVRAWWQGQAQKTAAGAIPYVNVLAYAQLLRSLGLNLGGLRKDHRSQPQLKALSDFVRQKLDLAGVVQALQQSDAPVPSSSAESSSRASSDLEIWLGASGVGVGAPASADTSPKSVTMAQQAWVQAAAKLAIAGVPVKLDGWDLQAEQGRLAPAGKGMAIRIVGANQRPSPCTMPVRPKASVRTIDAQSAPSPSIQEFSMSKSSLPELPPRHDASPIQSAQEAFAATQSQIESLVALQEQSARLHQQFLAHQEATLTRYQELIARQQNLVAAQLGLPVPEVAVVSPVPQGQGPFASSNSPETKLRAKPAISAAAAAFAGLTKPAAVKSTQSPTPAPVHPPAPKISNGPSSEELRDTLYAVVSDKTGYPRDILEPTMSLDDDLGIDSIKRVEIGSALSEQVSGLAAMDAQDLHELTTLQEWEGALMAQLAPSSGARSSSRTTPSKPEQIDLPLTEAQPSSTQPSSTQSFSPAQLRRVILEVVSDKTGYPHASLEWEMRLDEDLGIDSIKRVEIFASLQEQSGLQDLPPAEDLAGLITLESVYEGLFEFASQGETPVDSSALPAPPEQTPSPAQNSRDHAALMALLVEIVADKTGYPQAMIEPTMELDQELGIDSIKRVEIMSALAEQEPLAGELDAQALAEMPDLESLCQAILAHSSALDSSRAKAPEAEETAPPSQPQQGAEIAPNPQSPDAKAPARYVTIATPWEPKQGPSPQLADLVPAGATLWMVCAPTEPVGMALEQALLDLGYHVEQVSCEQDAQSLALPAGLVVVAPPWSLDTAYLSSLLGVMTAFGRARKQASVTGGFLLGVTQMNGAFGLGEFPVEADPLLGGVVGLVKTAAREWPTMRTLACDLAAGWTDADEIAVALLEQLDLPGPVERGLGRDGTVRELVVQAGAFDADQAKKTSAIPGIEFSDQDLALVSAGARGVTAKATLAMAEHGLKQFVLLGRSKAMLQEPDWIVGVAGEARMKSMIASKSSQKLHPRRLEARYREIMAGREIRAQIEALNAKGAEATYVSADLRDAAALKKSLDDAGIDPVKVSILVHGAGVLADARIEDKRPEDFASVYGTKVEGLVNLLAWCDTSPLRAIALFSSSTARFGRVGQADYAAANEVLNKIAAREAQVRPHCRVACINWGPWDGGMVTTGLKAQFASEGVFVLDAELAAKHLVKELAHPQTEVESVVLGAGSALESVFVRNGEPAQPADRLLVRSASSTPEIVMPQDASAPVPSESQAAATVSQAEQGPSFLQSLAAQHSPAKPAAPERTQTARQRNRATLSAAGKAVWKRSVSLKTDPYLKAHAFANRAVLPAAWMVEWMAQAAARLEPSLHLVGVDDFQVLRGVRLTQDEVCDLRVVVGRVDNRGDQRILQMHIASGPDLPGQSTLHGRARVVLADLAQQKLDGLERFPTLRSDDLWDLHQDAIYDLGLFHQDSFRLLGEIRGNRKQPDLLLGSLRDGLKADRWQGLGRVGEWLIHPEIMDAAFQMMIVWSLKTQGEASLPTSFGRYRQLAQFDPKTVKLAVHVRRRAPRRATADIVWRDLKGRIVATMRDFSCVMDPALRDAFGKLEIEPTPPPVDLVPKAVNP